MHKEGEEIHVETDEVRGGETRGVMRYVLVISLLLAVVVLSLVWIVPALTQGDVEEEATASGMEQSMDSSEGTDSIVSDGFDEMDEAAPNDDTGAMDTVEN